MRFQGAGPRFFFAQKGLGLKTSDLFRAGWAWCSGAEASVSGVSVLLPWDFALGFRFRECWAIIYIYIYNSYLFKGPNLRILIWIPEDTKVSCVGVARFRGSSKFGHGGDQSSNGG